MKHIVWWERSITPHQLHTLNELSQINGVQLTVYCQSLENFDRKKQGWVECDWLSLDINVMPKPSIYFIFKKIRQCPGNVNIFGGPFDSINVTIALFLSIFFKSETYILTEPFSPIASGLLDNGTRIKNIFRYFLRPTKFKILWILLRKKVNGVFAISDLAIKQLKDYKVAEDKIYPFGYYVPKECDKISDEIKLNNGLRDKNRLHLIFVGTLNYTKGVDLLIDQVNILNIEGFKISLDLYGPAIDINNYKLTKTIRYNGVIPTCEVQNKISEYDFLVLPSRYDGWGVVVNEAILSKTPVICSNKVGSSILVEKFDFGISYDFNDVNALPNTLKYIYQNKNSLQAKYFESMKRNSYLIDPKFAASYLLECLGNNANKGLFTNYLFCEERSETLTDV